MSNRVQLDKTAPDFTLTDADGQKMRLSDFRHNSNVLLVFNRGFV
jgi:peroxiredoxin